MITLVTSKTDPSAKLHKVTASLVDIAMMLNHDDASKEQWEDITPTSTATGIDQ